MLLPIQHDSIWRPDPDWFCSCKQFTHLPSRQTYPDLEIHSLYVPARWLSSQSVYVQVCPHFKMLVTYYERRNCIFLEGREANQIKSNRNIAQQNLSQKTLLEMIRKCLVAISE